jgi:hypothetical protein
MFSKAKSKLHIIVSYSYSVHNTPNMHTTSNQMCAEILMDAYVLTGLLLLTAVPQIILFDAFLNPVEFYLI